MFAVLETRRPGAQPFQTHDTIAIAGADGFAVAKATFAPRSVPPQFDAATVMQPEGYVAAGAVYYADGAGVVRRLDPLGRVRTVATFALTSPEQELSFAVSPDGSQVMAARLTFPKLGEGLPPTRTGNWALEILKAPAGGATTQLQHWQAGPDSYPDQAGGFASIFVVGWEASGPIGLVGANIGTQQGLFDGQRFFGGRLAYLGADGRIGATIGGSSCYPFGAPTAGRVICADTTGSVVTISIRSLDGYPIWSGQRTNPADSGLSLGGFVLSADGQRLAMDREVITLASGASLPLPASFTPAAWLGTDALIGTTQGNVAIVHLTPTTSMDNWGFSGQVVGTVPQ